MLSLLGRDGFVSLTLLTMRLFIFEDSHSPGNKSNNNNNEHLHSANHGPGWARHRYTCIIYMNPSSPHSISVRWAPKLLVFTDEDKEAQKLLSLDPTESE